MAIESNASTEEVMTGGMTLYSGLSNFTVIAINPNLEKLHGLGIMLKTEPEYTIDLNGEERFKITFWLKNEDTTIRMEVLANNNYRQSKTGKYLWMNAIGQETWSEEAPTYEWWKPEGQRKSYIGEDTLINFVKSWANVAQGGKVSFETIDAICGGTDLTELKKLAATLRENEVRCLVGVNNGKYQKVYTRVFGRVKPQRDDFFVKELNTEYGEFKADYDMTLAWGPFIPTVEPITADVEAVSETDDWV
jgi:hypothetical protein